MKTVLLVYRQEKLRPCPVVIVRVETDETIGDEPALILAIRDGVEAWSKNTDNGRSVYRYAKDDMNIGDISEYADEILPYCKGVKSLSFEYVTTATDWTYDTPLCGQLDND